MSRRARYGLVAAIISIFAYLFGYAQPTSHAQGRAMRYRLFVPGVVGPGTAELQSSAIELQTIELLNQQRRANGCPAVELNPELSIAAMRHSQDMADHNFLAHIGSDGSNFGQRAKAAGYTNQPSGEVIAAGYSTPADVLNGWMNSPSHRDIIVTCENDDVGVALVERSGTQYGVYWTAVFGQR